MLLSKIESFVAAIKAINHTNNRHVALHTFLNNLSKLAPCPNCERFQLLTIFLDTRAVLLLMNVV